MESLDDNADAALPRLALTLHGAWHADTFFVWAEAARSTGAAPPRRGRRPRIPPHPQAATPDELRAALASLAPGAPWETAPETARALLLPSQDAHPLLPPWLADDAAEPAGDVSLSPWRVPGLALQLLDAVDFLAALPARERERRFGADVRFWSRVAKLGLELLARQRYVPGLVEIEGRYRAVWLPALSDPADQARLRALAEAMPPVCRAVFAEKAAVDPAQAAAPHALLDDFIKQMVDQAVRAWGPAYPNERRKSPEGVAGTWWAALWAVDGAIAATSAQRRDLARLYDAWRGWLGQLRAQEAAAFRLCFRLEAPVYDEETGKVVQSHWTLRYLLQANADPSLLVTLDNVWQARGGILEYLQYRFENAPERALSGLGLAARLFPPILKSLRTARPEFSALTVDEAYAFLREVGALLEGSGFGVLVPPWWSKPGARLGLRAKTRFKDGANLIGKGVLSLDALVAFDWELALGEETLTREEFERLVALKQPLVRVRGQWVHLQPEELEAAIAFWEKQRRRREMTLRDALPLALGATSAVTGLPLLDVQASGDLAALLQQLQAGEKLAEIPAPGDFVGELRPYQARGLAWLAFMRRWGLGACLADDMGLGKTIQAIALLLHEREQAADVSPALLICPTSVVGNWQREVQRFAPALRVLVHHGAERARGQDFVAEARRHDLVISSYGLARRDIETLIEVKWSDVILDEAQNIKTAQARQAQAVRRLPAANRIALTGTPVENRLSELWSIMQFLNPGLLGSQADFRATFALPIERYQDQAATAQLRGLAGPFILRRLKTDPTIIQDLPDKLEMKVYCALTPEQATLYAAVVQESLAKIETAEADGASDFSRRGAILSALLRLKQICNHPAHFLGDGSALPGRSGKLERLTEMLEEVLDVDDRALIFTQFSEMGKLLQGYLQSLFGVEALYLHGDTPLRQRDRMVARFQGDDGPPLFILSLKAGGTGLNLTAANHVFHFDRWWNPAVEDQATDRAFRIGQRRDVQVHKFICGGSLEERIDALIESKKALAQSVIGAGESWLADLSTDALREIIALRQE